MADIFGADPQIGGAWQLDGAVLNIEEADEIIVSQINITYARGITKFTPLNQKKRYLVTGESNGDITMSAIIGPSKNIRAFIARYANACNVTQNVLTVMPVGVKACDESQETPPEFICNGVLLRNLSISVTQLGQGLTMVGAGMTMHFISLSIK